jgi:hypothetical protein
VVRFAVALDVAHHITQRGNARRFILETDAERGVYLDLLQQGIQRHGVELIGYCLMSNHIHIRGLRLEVTEDAAFQEILRITSGLPVIQEPLFCANFERLAVGADYLSRFPIGRPPGRSVVGCSWAFKIRSTEHIVFQLRVVAGAPKSSSISPR